MRSDDLKFCPRCAGPLAVRDAGHPASPHPTCTRCGSVLWQNLKPSIEAIITRGEGAQTEILLGRRADLTPEAWDLPGGFLNAGDRLLPALRRECRREMGIEVEVCDLLGVFEDEFYGERIISIVYECRVTAGEPYGADLIDEARWFPIDATPVLAYAAGRDAIDALRARLGR